MDNFFSVQNNSQSEMVIERSRFIANVFYAEKEEEAKLYLEQTRKKYSDATHNCYAYITDFGKYTKCSDDGEPSGTAGVPILEVLKNKKLVNVLVVITRYFGGIKLGAGGLVRAYSSATSLGIQTSQIKSYTFCDIFRLKLRYEEFNLFKMSVQKKITNVLNVEYGEEIIVEFAVEKSGYKPFIDSFSAVFYNKELINLGERYF